MSKPSPTKEAGTPTREEKTLDRDGIDAMAFGLAVLIGGILGAKVGLMWAVLVASLYVGLALVAVILSVFVGYRARAKALTSPVVLDYLATINAKEREQTQPTA